jgi:anti-sigma factor RsiW
MTINELSCQELVELVTDYLEEKLPAAERARFEAHLVGCSGCQNYLEQMRKTIQVVGKLREDHLTPESKAALLQRFRHWKLNPGGAAGSQT